MRSLYLRHRGSNPRISLSADKVLMDARFLGKEQGQDRYLISAFAFVAESVYALVLETSIATGSNPVKRTWIASFNGEAPDS